MLFFDVTIIQLASLFVFFNLFFLYAIRVKRNDIADVAWGLGFVLLAFVSVLYNQNLRTFIILVMVSIWGFRLASHIFARFKSHLEEDARYRKWRVDWGNSWRLYSWLKVFMLQGALLALVAMPIIIVARFSNSTWNIVNSLGVAIWVFGFVFEVLSDQQLRSFVKNRDRKTGPQIMQTGLWKYSRHPNYFGEAVLWWGICLVSFGLDYFYLALIGPLTILILLRFVSGVPMAEERYADNVEFQEYKQRTPAMLPKFY